MLGAHTYLHRQFLNLINFTLNPWPRIMDSAGKKEKRKRVKNRRTGRLCRPVLQLPTGQSCSLQTVGSNNSSRRSWRTWNEQGSNKASERGQEHVKGSGDGMAKASRHTACRTGHCRQTQPADSPPGTGLKINSQQLAGLAAKTTAADDVGLLLVVQCR